MKSNSPRQTTTTDELDFEKLQIDPQRKDALPIPEIPSRVATAIALSYSGREKEVISKLLQLNKAGRDFIVSQKGLPGFILKDGDYSQACRREFQLLETSDEFRQELLGFAYSQDKIDALPEKLKQLETP